MLEVHRYSLGGGLCGRVGQLAVIPVCRDSLLVVEGIAAVAVTLCTEEGRDGGEIRCSCGTERGEEFVEEGGGADEENGFGSEVKVAVVGFGLLVALVAVEGEVVTVEVAGTGGLHVAEECAVEAVVVAIG